MPQVSLLATFVGTLLGFVLGAVWYGPVFGKAWMGEHGFTEEQLTKDFNPGKTYGITFVLGFIAAYVFGMFLGPHPDLAFATGIGAVAGLCWVAFGLATNYLFSRHSVKLMFIDGGYHTVRFTLVGLAFGLLG